LFARMNTESDELVAELRKAVSIKKSEVAHLKEEFGNYKKHLALLTSEIAEGRAEIAANRIKIATLDADKFSCVQIEKLSTELIDKFDVMCKEVCAINEEAEKQVVDLQLEIEATKDVKNVISAYEETLGMLRIMRFCDNDGMNDTRRDIENAQNELQMLSDEMQVFEVNEKTLSDKLSTVAYTDIPLVVKHQIYDNLKKRKGELIRKLMHARLSRSRLDTRFVLSDL
uniref:IF rod domain-containing protein n=1 Tax=Brugia timori TaxID=42155 RepID=A0A0R3QMX1_9BILA